MPPSWFILLSLFVLGTIIGSFLNVVIYRLPRGLSLVQPGSRCPSCEHPIRWHDNLPILSWLWLRARCRDCGAQISSRYPLVELTVGLMFVALGWTDWVRPEHFAIEARAMPKVAAKAAADDAAEGIAKTKDAARPALRTEEFAWPLAYHLLLVCTLLAAALVDIDSHRLPRQLITWSTAAGILIAMFRPAVQAFPLFRSIPAADEWVSLTALATSFVGMLTAVMIRLGVQRFLGVSRAREMGLWNCTLALYAVGAFLGWEAVLVVAALAIVWTLVGRLPHLKSALQLVPPTAIAFMATLVWCLTERNLLPGG